jgi:sugar phosphate isomerase/epimerase
VEERGPLLGCTSMVLWRHTVAEAIGALSRAGFDTIEIWAEHLSRSGERPTDVAEKLHSAGLRCTVHCPIIDVNICSTNEAIAAASLRLYLEALEAAQSLEALTFVFHAGNLFSSFDPLPEYWQKLNRCLTAVREGNSSGIPIAVENMEIDKAQEVVKTAGDIRRVLTAQAGAGLGVCWDTTHLVTGEANRSFLGEIPRIDHIHLSDAWFEPPAPARKHLRLGEGNLELASLLAHPRAREARIVSLETVMIEPEAAELAREREKMEAILRATAAGGETPSGVPDRGPGGPRAPDRGNTHV